MAMVIDIKKDGKVVASLDVDTRGKENPFSTGSIGYHGNGKITINGKEHQANVLFTQIGTKGKYKN